MEIEGNKPKRFLDVMVVHSDHVSRLPCKVTVWESNKRGVIKTLYLEQLVFVSMTFSLNKKLVTSFGTSLGTAIVKIIFTRL